jgi:pimeloyl-ACP methyl ester carboxylesterase
VAEEVANAIPGSRLRVVPLAGHLSPLEQPDEVTDALLAWLHD